MSTPAAIDTHTHFFPEAWVRLLVNDGPANGATMGRNADGAVTFSFPGIKQVFLKGFIDLNVRLQHMDAKGLDMHCLSLTTPMVNWATPEFGLKLAQVYNDACSEACVKHPARLIGMAVIPMQAPELALQELTRASKLPGMRGLYMGTHINKQNLDEKAFYPIWAKCEALGWPVFLHPLDPLHAERLDKYYLRNVIGFPYATAIAVASLIFGGVMDAFPKLDVVLPHAGGMFPPLAGRWDHGNYVKQEMQGCKLHPSEYLKRFYYDTIAHNDAYMHHVISVVGVERIVMGSDYCFGIGDDHPVATVNRFAASLSGPGREMILGANAAKLLKL